jgi:hypothetical protein
VFCRRRVAELLARLPEIRAAGADAVVIGQGTPAMAAEARRETGWRGRLLVDGEGAAYRAAGLGRATPFTILRPALWRAAAAAKRAGFRQTATRGSAFRLGGTLVVAPGDRLLHAYRNRRPEDEAPLDDVLRSLAGGRGRLPER